MCWMSLRRLEKVQCMLKPEYLLYKTACEELLLTGRLSI